MKNWIILLIVAMSFLSELKAQEKKLKIEYINSIPEIDGLLDDVLQKLTVRQLPYYCTYNLFAKKKIDNSIPLSVSYRMAYNSNFFYIFIQVPFDSVFYRPNEGFWRGDGFQLVFTEPDSGNFTNTFYGLCFSAYKGIDDWSQSHFRIANRNGESWICGENTQFVTKKQNGMIGYEAIIAWKDIKPYNPFLMDSIGINLTFNKAINDSVHIDYRLKNSEHFESGMGFGASYLIAEFENPTEILDNIVLYQPTRYNYQESEYIQIIAKTSLSQKRRDLLSVSIYNSNDSIIYQNQFPLILSQKLTNQLLNIPILLQKGKYTLKIKSDIDSTSNVCNLVILPKIDFNQIHLIIDNSNKLSAGTVNSMMYRLLELKKSIENLLPFSPCDDINNQMNTFYEEYNQFVKDIDPFENNKIIYRHAFISKIDNSYQPYSVRLPKNYDKSRRYPLLVYLHGSGADDSELKTLISNDQYIEIAPTGRDKNGCYVSNNSQKDILEAITDAELNFSIDTSKILLGGYSMGGYGALLTSFLHPQMFKGVFIFSAWPNMASNTLNGTYPDFTKLEFLRNFKGKNIFICHGTNDITAPYKFIEETVAGLKSSEALVKFIPVVNGFHSIPNDEQSNKSFFEWIGNTLR